MVPARTTKKQSSSSSAAAPAAPVAPVLTPVVASKSAAPDVLPDLAPEIGDIVEVDRRYAVDGGAGKLVGIDDTRGRYRVKYFAGGSESGLLRHAFTIVARHSPMPTPRSESPGKGAQQQNIEPVAESFAVAEEEREEAPPSPPADQAPASANEEKPHKSPAPTTAQPEAVDAAAPEEATNAAATDCCEDGMADTMQRADDSSAPPSDPEPAVAAYTANQPTAAAPMETPAVEPELRLRERQEQPAAAAIAPSVEERADNTISELEARGDSSQLMVNNRGKRKRKSTLMTVDGQHVLKLNNYTMESGEPSIAAWQEAHRPQKPKSKSSAFNFFCKDYARANPFDGTTVGSSLQDHVKQQAEAWRGLSPSQRAPYEELAASDRLRFGREQTEYDEAM
jgi:hypothetical protein